MANLLDRELWCCHKQTNKHMHIPMGNTGKREWGRLKLFYMAWLWGKLKRILCTKSHTLIRDKIRSYVKQKKKKIGGMQLSSISCVQCFCMANNWRGEKQQQTHDIVYNLIAEAKYALCSCQCMTLESPSFFPTKMEKRFRVLFLLNFPI